MSHDNLDFVKNKAISTIFELLVAKPEQEKNLLTLLVNKLVCIYINYYNKIMLYYISSY